MFCPFFGAEPFQKESHVRVFCHVSNVCCASNRFLWESGQSFSRLFFCICFVTFWCKTVRERKHVRVFCDVSDVCFAINVFLWKSNQSLFQVILSMCVVSLPCKRWACWCCACGFRHGQTDRMCVTGLESDQNMTCADCLPHKFGDCITDVGHITENTNSAFPLGWFTNKSAKTWNKTENDLADCNKNVETASQTSVTSQKTLGIPLECFCAQKMTQH